MYYTQDVIEDVRNGNDIVEVINRYTQLKQKGSSYFGLCPFHKESTPSFSVSPDKQLFHCFGCGAAGNVFSFIMKIENFDFLDALKFLADRINYILPEEEYSPELKKIVELKKMLYDIHKKSARFYYNNLNSTMGIKAIQYLDNRAVNINSRKKFGLGYSLFKKDSLFNYLLGEGYDIEIILKSGLVLKDNRGGYRDRFFNRLMFPIIDVQGHIIGFGGRIIDSGEPKYLNSPDTEIFNKSHNLYGMNFAKNSELKEFILVEGYMDVISLYQAGFHNVIASLGTAFNDEHAKVLKRYARSVVLLFDSDTPGVNAVLRAIPVLIKNGLRVKVLQVNNAKDPDEYIKKFGRENFKNLLSGAKSYILFQLDCLKSKYDLNDTEQKIMFTNEAAKILSSLDNSIERDAFTKELSQITNISENAINSEILKLSSNISESSKKVKKYKKINEKNSDKGINEARKELIKAMSSNRVVYDSIKFIIKSKEFIEPVYVKLYEIISEILENNNTVYPAEIISYFETVEEQQIISDIFVTDSKYNDIKAFEKAINDWVKFIKNTYINESVSNAKDVNEIQILIDEKKNINKLNITLSDG